MASEHNRHPTLSRRQVALFERNLVCRLCYDICLDKAQEYGGVRFDLLQSLEVADELCEKIVQHSWELSGIEYYRNWVRNRLDFSHPAVDCTFATVCVTFSCMDDLPAPVRQLARDFQGLIIGEGNELYDNLRSAAYRQDITLAYDTYGEPPPEPSLVHEYEQVCQRAAELEQELTYYKRQLEMKNEEQKCKPNITIENHGSLTFIAEQKNDIHDNNNCPIYLMPEPRSEGGDEKLKVKGERIKDGDVARVKRLFMTDGAEDVERTEGEKNRFLNYLAEHHWGKKQVDCYKDNPINRAIVCFCVKWKRLKYIDKPSPAAVYRFLTETCGLECASETAAITASLGRLLKADYDKDTFDDVEDYF